jgi:PilZ domain
MIDCTVRDMSEKGARLRVPDEFAVPSRFVLRMKDTGENRKVAVRWQAGVDLGVEFES